MAGYSSNLAASLNYIWSKRDELGSGATGKVFRGMNKSTGQRCAVKVINPNIGVTRHQREVLEREIEVIRRLKHVNMVRCLDVEEEIESHRKVIVMELCSGGSLYQLLFDPVNKFGLSEDDFILLLTHLVAGMKYMNAENIVHRDIKPGNIMKAIDEDGRPVFKLCDFGAARELKEDESFTSIYGTEEYLHPDIYKEALLKSNPYAYGPSTTFNNRVDLWSLGITMYHAATGSLPFHPFEGARRDRQTMHFIITKKEHGVISGVENAEGSIEWSKTLPETCCFSRSLKKQLEVIIGGLVEVDPKLATTHDAFFSEMDNLLNMRVVHVFSLQDWHHFRLYLRPEDTLHDLKREIHREVGVDPGHQVIMTEGGKNLEDAIAGRRVEHLPHTSSDRPLIMWPSSADGMCTPVKPAHIALDQMPSHTAKADPFRDYNAALDAEGDIIAATNLIHSHQETMKLADRTVITQTSTLQSRIEQLNKIVPHLQRTYLQTEKHCRAVMDCVQLVRQIVTPVLSGQTSPAASQEVENMQIYYTQAVSALQQIEKNSSQGLEMILTLLTSESCDLSSQWDKDWVNSITEINNWPGRARNEQDLVHEITTQFKKDMESTSGRSTTRTTTHMTNTHKWERDNLNRSTKTVKSLLTDIQNKGVSEMQKRLKTWLRSSEDVMEKLDRAEDSIARLVNEQTASADMADKLQNDIRGCGRRLEDILAAEGAGSMTSTTSTDDQKQLMDKLTDVLFSFRREVGFLSTEVKENQARADELMDLTRQMEPKYGRRTDSMGGASVVSHDSTDALMSMNYMNK